MSLIQRIKTTLSKPFPYQENPFSLFRTIIAISLFVTFFLYIFKPFGLAQTQSNLFLICLGFGLATFVSYYVYEFIVENLFKLKSGSAVYTFGKWILQVSGLLICISLANFIFVRLVIFGNIAWEFFPDMFRGTFAVGIFPTVFFGGLALLRQERKFQKIAKELNLSESKPIKTTDQTERLIENIDLRNIRYIEALQNYVKIGHLNSEGLLIETTHRNSLKKILELSRDSFIVKCHRSFLVNRSTIVAAKGNAQGLVLTLDSCEKTIPVSRSYVSIFREK